MKSISKKIFVFVSMLAISALVAFGALVSGTGGFGKSICNAISSQQEISQQESEQESQDDSEKPKISPDGNLLDLSEGEEKIYDSEMNEIDGGEKDESEESEQFAENSDIVGDLGYSEALDSGEPKVIEPMSTELLTMAPVTVTCYYFGPESSTSSSNSRRSGWATLSYDVGYTYIYDYSTLKLITHTSSVLCIGFYSTETSDSGKWVGDYDAINYVNWVEAGSPTTVYARYRSTPNVSAQSRTVNVYVNTMDSSGNSQVLQYTETATFASYTKSDANEGLLRYYSCSFGFIKDLILTSGTTYYDIEVERRTSPSDPTGYKSIGYYNVCRLKRKIFNSNYFPSYIEFSKIYLKEEELSTRNVMISYKIKNGSVSSSPYTESYPQKRVKVELKVAYSGYVSSVINQTSYAHLSIDDTGKSTSSLSLKGFATSSSSTTATYKFNGGSSTYYYLYYTGSNNYLYAVYHGTSTFSISATYYRYFYYATGSFETRTSTGTTTTTVYDADFNYNLNAYSNATSTEDSFSATTYVSPTATKTGYTLVTWLADASTGYGDVSPNSNCIPRKGMPTVLNYFAKWRKDVEASSSTSSLSKTVNFNWNGGAGSVSSRNMAITKTTRTSAYTEYWNYDLSSEFTDERTTPTYTYSYSGSIVLPSQPQSYYLFANLLGWSSTSTGSVEYNRGGAYTYWLSNQSSSQDSSATASVTLYAKWETVSPSSSNPVTTVTVSPTTFTYNGSTQAPTVTVVHNGTTLSSTLITLSYRNSTGTTTISKPSAAGSYYIVVDGTSSYPAITTYRWSFTIGQDALDYVYMEINGTTYRRGGTYGNATLQFTYTGSTFYPSTIKVSGTKYTPWLSSSGYTLSPSSSNSNFINVGETTLTVTGKGNFKGTITVYFKIIRIDITSGYTFNLSSSTYTYNGSSKTPSVTCTDSKVTFSVSYSNNINAGTATVTITGTGSYTGTVKKYFTINKATISSASATLVCGSVSTTGTTSTSSQGTLTVTYQAGTFSPSFTVYDQSGNTVSSNYWSSSNSGDYTNAGTKTITISAKTYGSLDNYTGSVKFTLKINKKSISASDVSATLSTTEYTYNGVEKTPTVTLTYNGVNLTKGSTTAYDCQVTYTNNTDAGRATVTITAKEVNYTGSRTLNFTINKATIYYAYFTKSSSGSTESSVTNAGSLSETYTRNTRAFTLSRVHTSSSSNIDVPSSNYTVTYKRGSSTTTDFINVGTITVTIAANSTSKNFTGSITFSLKIVQRTIASSSYTFSLATKTYVYDGNAKRPVVNLSSSDPLVLDTDYSVAYSNNVNASTSARVDISGIGNYTGKVTLYFTINAATLSYVRITIDGTVYEFSASNKTKSIEYKRAEYDIKFSSVLDQDKKVFTSSDFYKVTFSRTSFRNVSELEGDVVITVSSKSNASGITNYVGELVVTIKITRLSINGFRSAFLLSNYSFNYTGSGIEPQVNCSDDDITFSVAYSNNIDATETATVTITGTRNYKDSFQLQFVINPIHLKLDGVIFSDETVTYDKGYHKIGVKNVSTTLANLLNDITYTVVIKRNNNSIDFDKCRDVNDYIFTAHFSVKASVARNYILDIDTMTATLTIIPKNLNTLSKSLFTVVPSSQIYTGREITVSQVLCSDNDVTYEIVRHANNINVTTAAEVYIEGNGNYTGTIFLNFSITPAKIVGVRTTIGNSQSLEPMSVEYKRSAYVATFIVFSEHGNTTQYIVPEDCYTTTYSRSDGRPGNNFTDAGVITITFTAKANTNFTGTTQTTVTITRKELTNEDVRISVTSNHTYNGKPQIPTYTVEYYGVILAKDVEYSEQLTNNIDAGNDATIEITFIGNYSGSAVQKFTINQARIDLNGIYFDNDYVVYDGSAHKIAVNTSAISADVLKTLNITYKIYTVEGTRRTLLEGATDVKDIGSYVFVATISPINTNYYIVDSTLEANLVISKATLNSLDFSLEQSSYVYDGKVHKPLIRYNGDRDDITIEMHYRATISGADTEPKDVGTYYAVAVATGNFSGSVVMSYTITRAPIERLEITIREVVYNQDDDIQFTFDGESYEPQIEVFDINGIKLLSTNYTISFTRNSVVTTDFVETGTINITVSVNSNNNWSGSLTSKIIINIIDVEHDEDGRYEISSVGDYYYNGKPQVAEFSVVYKSKLIPNGVTLKKDRDYTVSVEEGTNIDAGIVEVSFTFIGNYVGEETSSFEIKRAKISRVVVTVDGKQFDINENNKINAEVVYNGLAFYPSYAVYAGSEGDYIVLTAGNYSYEPNTTILAVGDYHITFSAHPYSQNFEGSFEVTITVKPIDIADAQEAGEYSFYLVQNEFVYDQYAHRPEVRCSNRTVKFTFICVSDESSNEDISPTDSGTYFCKVMGTGNWAGEVFLKFEIKPAELSLYKMSTDGRTYGGYNANLSSEFTGNPFTLYINVYDSNSMFVRNDQNENYTIKYLRDDADTIDFTSAGVITIEITAVSGTNYTGKLTAMFTINKIRIDSNNSKVKFDLDSSSFTYDSKEHKPKVIFTLNGEVQGDDVLSSEFNISYHLGSVDGSVSESVNAGTYFVVVEGSGSSFDGTWSKQYTINPANITDFVMTANETPSVSRVLNLTYSGEPASIEFVVSSNDLTLKESEFEVTYSRELVSVGTVRVTVTAKADESGVKNFNGTLEGSVVISALPVRADEIEIELDSSKTYVYNGQPHIPTFTVKFNEKALQSEIDYTSNITNNVNAGDGARIDITLRGNYSGTASKTFSISPAALKSIEITVGELTSAAGTVSVLWTNSPISPIIRVFDINNAVVSADFYTCTYTKEGGDVIDVSSIIDAGTYKVKIALNERGSNYTGTVEGTIIIVQDKLSIAGYTANVEGDNFVYNGGEHRPNVTVKDTNSNVLTESDYDVDYQNNIEVGTAKVIVTGKGNYYGTLTAEFEITQAKIDLSSVIFVSSEVTFDSKPHKIVAQGFDGTLVRVSYSVSGDSDDVDACIDIGTYNFTATFEEVDSHNYAIEGERTKTATLTIKKLDISENPELSGNVSFRLEYNTVVYDGSVKKPSVSIVKTGDFANMDIGYSVMYLAERGGSSEVEPKNVGTYFVKITADGNFTGEFYLEFSITKATIDLSGVVFNNLTVTYNGEMHTIVASNVPSSEIFDTAYSVTNSGLSAVGTSFKDVGTYVFTVKFTIKGEYEQNYMFHNRGTEFSKTATLQINSANINQGGDTAIEFSLSQNYFTYDGSAHKPTVSCNREDIVYSSVISNSRSKEDVNENPIDAGTYYVIITVTGNYTGEVVLTYEIGKAELDFSKISFKSSTVVYDGLAHSLVINEAESSLPEGQGVLYSLSYTVTLNGRNYEEDCINVGNYIFTLSITLLETKNHYISGATTVNATLSIVEASVEDDENIRIDVVVDSGNFVYSGRAYTPGVVIDMTDKAGRKTLTSTDDYSLEYSNNINAGQAQIIITFKGNLNGTKIEEFTIKKAKLSSAQISYGSSGWQDSLEITYTGSAILPQYRVTAESGIEVPKEYYSVSYKNGSNFVGVGTYEIEFNAKANGSLDNFEGKAATSIVIKALDVTDDESLDISVRVDSRHIYTGLPQTPSVTLTINGTVIDGSNYTISVTGDNVNAGTCEFEIQFVENSNYTGTIESSFEIEKQVVDLSAVRFNNLTVSFDNKPHTITVSNYESKSFVTLTYSVLKDTESVETCTDVGTYNFTATFAISDEGKNLNNYIFHNGETTFVLTANLFINRVGFDQNDNRFTYKLLETSFVYDGSAKEPGVEVTFNGEPLEKGKDFDVRYTDLINESSAINAGTARAIITGKGNFASDSSVTLNFEIKKASLSYADVTINEKVYSKQSPIEFTFSGESFKPSAIVVYSVVGEKTLKVDDEFYVVTDYSSFDFVNVATLTITITPKVEGVRAVNYEGVISIDIVINPKDVETTPGTSIEITVNNPELYVYNGESHIPSVTVKVDGEVIDDSNYDLQIVGDNINAGNCEFEVVFKNNYSGRESSQFTIKKATIDLSEVVFDGDEVTFDGNLYTLEATNIPESNGLFIFNYTTTGGDNPQTLSFSDAGTYVFTLHFNIEEEYKRNYMFQNGSDLFEISATLQINRMSIDVEEQDPDDPDITFALDRDNFVYDGTAKKPEVICTVSEKLGEIEVTYSTFYATKVGEEYRKLENPIDAGTYYVVIDGEKNFEGRVVLEFVINKAKLARLQISSGGITSTGNTLSVVFTGKNIEFEVYVYDEMGNLVKNDGGKICYEIKFYRGGVLLEEGGDFANIGRISIVVTANELDSNYSGELGGSLEIVNLSIADSDIIFSLNFDGVNLVFDNTPKTPSVEMQIVRSGKFDGLDVKYSVSYRKNINAGTAEVLVEGTENFTGMVILTFEIRAIELGNIKVVSGSVTSTGSTLSVVYTGSKIDVGVVAYDKDGRLVDPANYDVLTDDDMINAGRKLIRVVSKTNADGTHNYSGEAIGCLNIEAKDISGYDFEISGQSEFTFDGSLKEPDIVCLQEEVEFYVVCRDNRDVGVAEAVVRGSGNYTGEKVIEFSITKSTLDRFNIVIGQTTSSGSIITTVYIGEEIRPSYVIYDIFGNLVSLDDVEVELVGSLVERGRISVTIKSKQNSKGNYNYDGTLSGTIIIAEKPLDAADFSLEQTEFTYTGLVYRPEVIYHGSTLIVGIDYKITYTGNVNAGTGYAIVSGIGNYTGEIRLEFNIAKALLPLSQMVGITEKTVTFNGHEQNVDYIIPSDPRFNFTFVRRLLSFDEESNEILGDVVGSCVNVGTYKVTILFESTDSNYYIDLDKLEANLTIIKAWLSESMFLLEYQNTEFKNSYIEPELSINYEGLTENDFTYRYKNNFNVGRASVEIVGQNNFDGTVEIFFNIQEAIVDVSELEWDYTEFTYDGEQKEIYLKEFPAFLNVTYTGNTATLAGNYEANAKFEASSNYRIIGNVPTCFWEIKRKEVYTGDISAPSETTIEYDGYTHEVEVYNVPEGLYITFEFTNEIGETLLYCSHAGVYQVKINFNADSNHVIAEGEVTFITTILTITSKNFAAGGAVFLIEPIANQRYTGEAIEPKLVVRNIETGSILTEGVDYELQYLNNIAVGTAIVIVNGIGNYSGEMSVTFQIVGDVASDTNNAANGASVATEMGIIIGIISVMLVIFVVTIVVVVKVLNKKKNNDEDYL